MPQNMFSYVARFDKLIILRKIIRPNEILTERSEHDDRAKVN